MAVAASRCHWHPLSPDLQLSCSCGVQAQCLAGRYTRVRSCPFCQATRASVVRWVLASGSGGLGGCESFVRGKGMPPCLWTRDTCLTCTCCCAETLATGFSLGFAVQTELCQGLAFPAAPHTTAIAHRTALRVPTGPIGSHCPCVKQRQPTGAFPVAHCSAFSVHVHVSVCCGGLPQRFGVVVCGPPFRSTVARDLLPLWQLPTMALHARPCRSLG